MNTHARDQYPPLQDDDWNSHGYTDPQRDEAAGTPLRTDIHPMFSFKLDQSSPIINDTRRWGSLTMSEYRLTQPVLRLTSAMLQSPRSEDVIYFVMYGERYIPKDLPKHKGLPILEFRRHEEERSVIHEKVQEALKKLAETITFQLSDANTMSTTLAYGACGRTTAGVLFHPEGINITGFEGKKGSAPVTVINNAYLSTLKRLLRDPAQNRFKILKLQFEMSVTICHEILHAINLATDPDLLKHFMQREKYYAQNPSMARKKVDYNEPLYVGQRVAELGFFWENEVLGGCLTAISLYHGDHPVMISEWPTFEKRHPEEYPERTGPVPVSTAYLVSAYYIQNVQSREFWDFFRQQDSEDHDALRVRKSVGIHKVYDKYDFDKAWEPEGSSEMKWLPIPGTLRVLRNDGDASICAARANETPDERTARLATA